MGIEICQTEFTQGESAAFCERLEHNLDALEVLLARPGFGIGPGSVGAELEIYLVDEAGRALYRNQEILADADDPQLTLELNRYNLEYNLSPGPIAGGGFRTIENEIVTKLNFLSGVAAGHGGRVVPIGILPTLTQEDLGPKCITDRQRYHALVAQLMRRRSGRFQIDINGAQPLRLDLADITLEGANTSFQVHYRVEPQVYAETFNAIQLMTPLALALGANSPTLFGHALWNETRVPLFKQSIDTRHIDRYGWNQPARVHFGRGWARRGAAELFAEVVRVYEPLLPVCSDEDPIAVLVNGGVPELSELRLHQSTAWLWNRPIYDPADGGMLRVEMRALPAGPSAVDMVANAVFLIGLAEGIRPQLEDLLPGCPFQMADYNFYRAAQHGLDAKLVWPGWHQHGCAERPIMDILTEMLPVAVAGLERIGVSRDEVDRYMGVIERRLATRRSGARWQLAMLNKLGHDVGRGDALHPLLEAFMERSASNTPVAEWTL